jgi:oligopeptide/dipeptide ABC transporter ATP-binding protein
MVPLLRVDGLNVSFYTRSGTVPAVSDVSFDIGDRETLACVGESGCGKSVTALALLGLIPPSVGKVEARRIEFRNRNLLTLTPNEWRAVRGGDIAMIFQEPMSSLNPVFRIGSQLVETVVLHRHVSGREARRIAVEALNAVGIPDAEARLRAYPHELSGGLRQRVMIAMAIACRPALLIADEPTTALDVTIQAQILDVLRRLQDELGMAMLLITHDLGVVAEMAHRVVVMYAGQIVESATVEALFASPSHPYTQGLLRSAPVLADPSERLKPIEGTVPDLREWREGCRFEARCPIAFDACRQRTPSLEPLVRNADARDAADPHRARCFALDNPRGIYIHNETKRMNKETLRRVDKTQQAHGVTE